MPFLWIGSSECVEKFRGARWGMYICHFPRDPSLSSSGSYYPYMYFLHIFLQKLSFENVSTTYLQSWLVLRELPRSREAREPGALLPTTLERIDVYVVLLTSFLPFSWFIPDPNLNDSYTQGSNSGGLFSSLVNQKRNSTDAAAAARRQSFHDQKPQGGFLGKMWNKCVFYSKIRRWMDFTDRDSFTTGSPAK